RVGGHGWNGARDGGGFAVFAADGQKPVGIGGASHFRCGCHLGACHCQLPQDRRRMALALGRSIGVVLRQINPELMWMALLEVKDLHVEIDGREILKGLDLDVKAGEVHAIMGPNGSGKSTLAYVLAGKEEYRPTAGEVRFDGQNLFEMEPDERAAGGLFLAFQYPLEIPGV